MRAFTPSQYFHCFNISNFSTISNYLLALHLTWIIWVMMIDNSFLDHISSLEIIGRLQPTSHLTLSQWTLKENYLTPKIHLSSFDLFDGCHLLNQLTVILVHYIDPQNILVVKIHKWQLNQQGSIKLQPSLDWIVYILFLLWSSPYIVCSWGSLEII